MLSKDFTQRVERTLEVSPIVRYYVSRAQSEDYHFMDAAGNWLSRSKEQTLFLVLLMQTAFDYNYSFAEKMPWRQLYMLFNIPNYNAYRSFERVMATNYKELSQTRSDLLKGYYPRVFKLFNEKPS